MPTYTYQSNIPQPSNRLKDSQADLLENFQAIQELIDVNHVAFNTGDSGKHKWVTFPVQGSAPSFDSGESGLFNATNATTTKNELYVHKPSFLGEVDIPFTASILSNTALASCDYGWSYLPSGLLIKWGAVAGNASTVTINFQALSGGPAYTNVFRVYLSPFDSGTAVNFTCGQRSVATTTSVSAYCNNPSGTASIRYLILGA